MEISGIRGLFASPIAVMAPIWEELVQRKGATPLRYHHCRHELLAVALASGCYQITGEPQVVFLPTNLGVQNGSMGLRSALQDHVTMVIIAMDSLSWGEDPAFDPGLEWPFTASPHRRPCSLRRGGCEVVQGGAHPIG